MQTLTRSLKGRAQEGRSLPSAFNALESVGAKVRYGQVALIVGGPGAGKSAFALEWAMRAQVPTLYFSADSDRLTLGTRIGASITRQLTDDVEAGLTGPDRAQWHKLIDEKTSHMWFDWTPSPSLDDLGDELYAYATVTGQWPGLIVIDNLKNIYGEDGADHERYNATISHLNEFAREYGSAVICLHHATGAYEDGYTPIPLSGLLGKTGKDATLVLTLHRADENLMGVSVVKNRVGKADPGASNSVLIPFYPERQYFGD